MKTYAGPVVDEDEETWGMCHLLVSKAVPCHEVTESGYRWYPFVVGGTATDGGDCPLIQHIRATPLSKRKPVWDCIIGTTEDADGKALTASDCCTTPDASLIPGGSGKVTEKIGKSVKIRKAWGSIGLRAWLHELDLGR